MHDDLLACLTPAQREAVTHVEGPLLVLAGPGSGKTRVITYRIAYLLRLGIPDASILGLTFTNKAAQEMQSRVQQLVPGSRVWLGTFHRFAAQTLRKYANLVGLESHFTIYDKDDSLRALRSVIADARIDLGSYSPEAVAQAISSAKSALLTPQDYQPRDGSPLGDLVARIYPLYQERLRRSNAVDFDDLLMYLALLLRESPEIRHRLDSHYRFVMVDEYQDTNLVQYAIARAISVEYPNLAVTGDPDQSIYGWRGANLNNILEFEKDFPNVRVVRLEQNYRSTKRILAVAATLIAHNVRRKEKDLFTDNEEGRPVRLVTYADNQEEAEDIAEQIARAIKRDERRPRDFAIFYRINALSRGFEIALRERGIPYQIVNGVEFFQRKEIKDVIAYLQLINNPRDDVAFLRVINTPPRSIGETSVRRLREFAAAHGLCLLEAARHVDAIPEFSIRTMGAFRAFVNLYDRLVVAAQGPVEELLGLVLTETGYREYLEKSQNMEDQERLANIEELLTVARQFDERYGEAASLESFLEETSLVSDTDALDESADRVTLMTLHASKGLEFPVVFLVACEQGILPHERSRNDMDELEEERRLMFVGITRAKQELQISMAEYRDFRGQRKLTIPSQFLMELPREHLEIVTSSRAASRSTSWVGTSPAPEHAFRASAWAAPRSTSSAPQPSPRRVHGGPLTPDDFVLNMSVVHPRYGVGRIVALSGSGDARKATVDFGGSIGKMKFILSQSPLRPK
ncbi:UvrD-helicase domain-containing protein [Thermogutta sp.]|uniref:ATP-dependent helicase n=1 Tax=Thermogutta sp. TaxID=1962930 RepID=UPI00322077B4